MAHALPLMPPVPSDLPTSQPIDSTAWYAVRTRSRHEATARGHIAGRGIEAFFPTMPKWSRWKDRKKRVDWPLFPGYGFARFSREHVRQVVTCPGVVGIVSVEGEPVPVPASEIDAVRTLVESDLRFDSCPFLTEGMRVEVTHGALKGVRGRLVRKGAHARLVLSVDLIGQGVTLDVDAADVKAL